MLSRLIIKNIALINEIEISLCEGMNVLSGETGAGKSIIVDSVNLVLARGRQGAYTHRVSELFGGSVVFECAAGCMRYTRFTAD
jgi:DNA repair protein RecN (Recombination protein N)